MSRREVEGERLPPRGAIAAGWIVQFSNLNKSLLTAVDETASDPRTKVVSLKKLRSSLCSSLSSPRTLRHAVWSRLFARADFSCATFFLREAMGMEQQESRSADDAGHHEEVVFW